MQIPHPHINNRAKDVFKRIYRGRRIDVTASRSSLKEQLDLFLDHIGHHMGHKVLERDRKRIWSAVERNNEVSKVLSSSEYKDAVKKNKKFLGNVILGQVFCIDGRIPAIFVGGRFARHFEIPAAQVQTTKRKSDGKLIPDSTDLNEALRIAASEKGDILEVVFAHTSLLDPHHGCGAMVGKRKAGELDPKLSNEVANLKIIKETTIPALTNIYNEFREQVGVKPLKTVGIPAIYDTDTFGMILNYDLEDQGKSFSTTELTQKFQKELDDYFIKENLIFGSFKEQFSELKFLPTLTKNLLKIVDEIWEGKVVPELSAAVDDYIKTHFPTLTQQQRRALRFLLIRNITFQYLTGMCKVKKSGLDHPFAEHEEASMAVAMRGATIGKFDPQNQVFSSTPADPKEAIENIKVMLSIMGDSPKIKPYILFVCNSIDEKDLRDNGHIVQRLMGSNAGLLRDIVADKDLGGLIEKGEMIPVPLLIDEDSREVLKIADHSPYV